jgi:hypothetical protein
LMIAVKCEMSNIPMLEIVNVPPWKVMFISVKKVQVCGSFSLPGTPEERVFHLAPSSRGPWPQQISSPNPCCQHP